MMELCSQEVTQARPRDHDVKRKIPVSTKDPKLEKIDVELTFPFRMESDNLDQGLTHKV